MSSRSSVFFITTLVCLLMLLSRTSAAGEILKDILAPGKFGLNDGPQRTLPFSTRLSQGGCPVCDSSVYSYCDEKIFHDSCCCSFGGNGLGSYSQCQYADCTYLHANSCYEHKLIVECCCYSPYR